MFATCSTARLRVGIHGPNGCRFDTQLGATANGSTVRCIAAIVHSVHRPTNALPHRCCRRNKFSFVLLCSILIVLCNIAYGVAEVSYDPDDYNISSSRSGGGQTNSSSGRAGSSSGHADNSGGHAGSNNGVVGEFLPSALLVSGTGGINNFQFPGNGNWKWFKSNFESAQHAVQNKYNTGIDTLFNARHAVKNKYSTGKDTLYKRYDTKIDRLNKNVGSALKAGEKTLLDKQKEYAASLAGSAASLKEKVMTSPYVDAVAKRAQIEYDRAKDATTDMYDRLPSVPFWMLSLFRLLRILVMTAVMFVRFCLYLFTDPNAPRTVAFFFGLIAAVIEGTGASLMRRGFKDVHSTRRRRAIALAHCLNNLPDKHTDFSTICCCTGCISDNNTQTIDHDYYSPVGGEGTTEQLLPTTTSNVLGSTARGICGCVCSYIMWLVSTGIICFSDMVGSAACCGTYFCCVRPAACFCLNVSSSAGSALISVLVKSAHNVALQDTAKLDLNDNGTPLHSNGDGAVIQYDGVLPINGAGGTAGNLNNNNNVNTALMQGVDFMELQFNPTGTPTDHIELGPMPAVSHHYQLEEMPVVIEGVESASAACGCDTLLLVRNAWWSTGAVLHFVMGPVISCVAILICPLSILLTVRHGVALWTNLLISFVINAGKVTRNVLVGLSVIVVGISVMVFTSGVGRWTAVTNNIIDNGSDSASSYSTNSGESMSMAGRLSEHSTMIRTNLQSGDNILYLGIAGGICFIILPAAMLFKMIIDIAKVWGAIKSIVRRVWVALASLVQSAKRLPCMHRVPFVRANDGVGNKEDGILLVVLREAENEQAAVDDVRYDGIYKHDTKNQTKVNNDGISDKEVQVTFDGDAAVAYRGVSSDISDDEERLTTATGSPISAVGDGASSIHNRTAISKDKVTKESDPTGNGDTNVHQAISGGSSPALSGGSSPLFTTRLRLTTLTEEDSLKDITESTPTPRFPDLVVDGESATQPVPPVKAKKKRKKASSKQGDTLHYTFSEDDDTKLQNKLLVADRRVSVDALGPDALADLDDETGLAMRQRLCCLIDMASMMGTDTSVGVWASVCAGILSANKGVCLKLLILFLVDGSINLTLLSYGNAIKTALLAFVGCVVGQFVFTNVAFSNMDAIPVLTLIDITTVVTAAISGSLVLKEIPRYTTLQFFGMTFIICGVGILFGMNTADGNDNYSVPANDSPVVFDSGGGDGGKVDSKNICVAASGKRS